MDCRIVLVLIVSFVCSEAEVARDKRAKYLSNPPPYVRYHKRPPPPDQNIISYTPPPGYHDSGPGPRRPQVSKQNLQDEDIHNIAKYLTKTDLDKIIQFANEKERTKDMYQDMNYNTETNHQHNRPHYRPTDLDNKHQLTKIGDFGKPITKDYRGPNFDDSKTNDNFKSGTYQSYDADELDTSEQVMKDTFSESLNTEGDMKRYKVRESTVPDVHNQVSYKDTSGIPKMPENTLNDDYIGSDTKNVPKVVRPYPGYKVESFGDLPLMEYLSKLHTVDSYNVPHYSITNPGSSSKPHPRLPPVEPAPPASVLKDHSDAHLKAVQVWVHKSKGQAYTLNKDGTLTVERPIRNGYRYGE